MSMEDAKKLVRGLRDVSPLFVAPPETTPTRHALELQVLGVSSPDGEGDSLFFNSFFATQLASGEKACSLVSVLPRHTKALHGIKTEETESFGNNLQRHCLYWDELKNLVTRSPASREGAMLEDRDIFLDFEYRQLFQFDQAACLLDKWILLLKPTAESLTEGYKIMKAGLALNPRISFFITLEGRVDAVRGEWVFERFSDLVFKHLNAGIGWLGWVDLSDPERHFSTALHLDPLLHQPWNARPDLGKFALADWVELLERKERSMALKEVSR